MKIPTPLSTQGTQIVDANGSSVLLRGVNWFGMETDVHVPHGLWVRDYREILTQIKDIGYNSIRLPFSVNALLSTNISGVDFSIGNNRDLQGKTPLQVMDIIIQTAASLNLLIILDCHRLNDQRIPELWYGDGFTEADWINLWKTLANRYKNQWNVVGADLKNEPHGVASWGTNDLRTDWRLAAERCGNAILTENPNWLIIVEGVEKNVPGQQLTGHWWGGNLEGVRNYPLRLSVPNKLVYSPHEYGPGVFNSPWFDEPTFPQNLFNRWQKGFFYIVNEKIAPVWIGEFGGRQVDTSSKEGIWQRQLVDFIGKNNLGFAYWSWNPNSSDTGGILLDDWKTVDTAKQNLLKQLLTNPNPENPTPEPTPTPINQSDLNAEIMMNAEWNSGFCVNFRVTNKGNQLSKKWRLSFVVNQAKITQTWNGTFLQKADKYEVIPANWAQQIQPANSVEVGYCADKLGTNFLPTQVTIEYV